MGGIESVFGFNSGTEPEDQTGTTKDPRVEREIPNVGFYCTHSICRVIHTLLEQKKVLFKESTKMEQCIGRLRSYLTTEQTAKFLILMEKVQYNEMIVLV